MKFERLLFSALASATSLDLRAFSILKHIVVSFMDLQIVQPSCNTFQGNLYGHVDN
jgi:hypothetical protein